MSYISKDNAIQILQQSPPFFWQSSTAFEKVIPQRSHGLFGNVKVDGILTLNYDGDSFRFAVQITESSSTAALQAACQQALLSEKIHGLPSLIIVPYLRNEQVQMFRDSGIGLSIIDLCGNAMISIPSLHVLQKGEPNKFPDSRRIKNPYRGNSALVGRAFLKQPVFSSIGAIHKLIIRQRCSLGLSAISKAVAELEEELILIREGQRVRLCDPIDLLHRLARNYHAPDEPETIDLKINMNEDAIPAQMKAVGHFLNAKICATGRTSFTNYAGGATNDCTTYYVDSPLKNFVQNLKRETEVSVTHDSVFPNARLIHCPDQVVYFDCHHWMNGIAASPVQTYVELQNGDPREVEMAERVKDVIIEELADYMDEQKEDRKKSLLIREPEPFWVKNNDSEHN